MSFCKSLFSLLLLAVTACADMTDDLNPSGEDKRPVVEAGSIGPYVGQQAPDFTLSDTLYTFHTLSTELTTANGIVLYFNMWCPLCDSHMSHMRENIVPDFPLVSFFVVDYVTGSVSLSRSSQVANGFTDFTVLVDIDQYIVNSYNATMGTTVVIDSNGSITMNEDYKDGSRLRTALESLP